MAVREPQLLLFTLKIATFVFGNGTSKMSSMYVEDRDKMRWVWTAVGKPTVIWNKKNVILRPLKCEV